MDEMQQLCRSSVSDGEYDQIIENMLPHYALSQILAKVMEESRGHENPALVERRILYLRELRLTKIELGM